MFSPQDKLKRLLKYKIEIQGLEEENIRNKDTWSNLGALVRHTSQKIGVMKKTLIEMI